MQYFANFAIFDIAMTDRTALNLEKVALKTLTKMDVAVTNVRTYESTV